MKTLQVSVPLLLLLAGGCGSASHPGGTGGGGTAGGGSGGVAGGTPDASAAGAGGQAGGGQDAGAGGSVDGGEPVGGVGGSVGTSVALTDFSQAFGTAFCQRIQQCCMPMSFDPESCLNELKTVADELANAYQPYLMSGKAVYRPEKAAACINALLGAPCAVVQSGSMALNDAAAACAVAFDSTVAPGGACMDDLECNAGWCDPDTMKCVARKADGEACEDDGDCLSDNCSPNTLKCLPHGVEGICP
jgi:hypothetical protein